MRGFDHAEPRATKDLEILIGADSENSKAVYAALAKFGAPVEGLTAKDFTDLDSLFRMGTPPVMVDIMPRISGIEFEDAWLRRVDIPIDAAALRASAQHRENVEKLPNVWRRGRDYSALRASPLRAARTGVIPALSLPR